MADDVSTQRRIAPTSRVRPLLRHQTWQASSKPCRPPLNIAGHVLIGLRTERCRAPHRTSLWRRACWSVGPNKATAFYVLGACLVAGAAAALARPSASRTTAESPPLQKTRQRLRRFRVQMLHSKCSKGLWRGALFAE